MDNIDCSLRSAPSGRIRKPCAKDYIVIGKYKISTAVIMTFPCQVSVEDTETHSVKLYYDYKFLNLLYNEGLDAQPLLDLLKHFT